MKQNHYDIVFMDHMMPDMDGIEATRHIRGLGMDVTIIALTACAVLGTKEIMIAAGMNDYLSKPIISSQLKHILLKWLPVEKQLSSSSPVDGHDNGGDNNSVDFWKKIGQIEEITLSKGLDMVEDQRDTYEQMLKLMITEIEKCDRNLKKFLIANDMRNFCIEVHSIKSSLAIIGAIKLESDARELEFASNRNDSAFCASNLPGLLENLGNLRLRLKEAFSIKGRVSEPFEIPPELPPILERLTRAFREMDIVAIDKGVERLTALNLTGALVDEIEQITDAATITDFDYAIEVIEKLTSISSR